MAVKWGVLGTANIARGCTIPGMKQADNCELYAIAGRDMAKAESFHGSKGTISSDVEYNQAGDLSYTVTVDGKKTERKIKAEQNYKLESEQLGRCIEKGEEPHVSQAFSLRNAGLLDSILAQIGY